MDLTEPRGGVFRGGINRGEEKPRKTMHEGHRRRMYEKLKQGDGLYDHELLEILLFNAFTRTNTNPIAHRLLKAFGSIQGVFDADVAQLVTVEGVGERVALYLKCVGECYARMRGRGGSPAVKNFADFKDYAAKRLRGRMEEVLELNFMDRNGKVIYVYTTSSGELHRVKVQPEKISEIMTAVKPSGMFAAHNHLGGDSKPSENDDDFTGALLTLCRLHNVKLYDHVIYAADNNIFSYFTSGRLDKIARSLKTK